MVESGDYFFFESDCGDFWRDNFAWSKRQKTAPLFALFDYRYDSNFRGNDSSGKPSFLERHLSRTSDGKP
jgi:hypothetical protein